MDLMEEGHAYLIDGRLSSGFRVLVDPEPEDFGPGWTEYHGPGVTGEECREVENGCIDPTIGEVPEELRLCVDMEKICLDNSHLIIVPRWLFGFKNLRSVYLAHNHITQRPHWLTAIIKAHFEWGFWSFDGQSKISDKEMKEMKEEAAKHITSTQFKELDFMYLSQTPVV